MPQYKLTLTRIEGVRTPSNDIADKEAVIFQQYFEEAEIDVKALIRDLNKPVRKRRGGKSSV